MPELSIKTLRLFELVASKGSISSAAVASGIAQSAVSHHISVAEELLGGPLFHRHGRGVSLTSHGRLVRQQVEPVLTEFDGLQARAHQDGSQPSGLVTLGLVAGVSAPASQQLFGLASKRFPKIRLRILEGYSGEMERAVIDGLVDMAVVNRYRAKGQGVYRELFESQLCLVCRPAAMEAHLKRQNTKSKKLPAQCPASWLSGFPLVLPAPPNALLQVLNEQARIHKIELNVVLECTSPWVMRQTVLSYDCATILPRHALRDEIQNGSLVALPIRGKAFQQHVVLVTSTKRPFTEADKVIADLLGNLADWLS